MFCLFMFVIDPFIEDVRAIGHIFAIFSISLKREQYIDDDCVQLCPQQGRMLCLLLQI